MKVLTNITHLIERTMDSLIKYMQ